MSSTQAQRTGRASRAGRPSKGDRVGLMVRVPRGLAALFADDASAKGVSQSDRMAEILDMLYETEGVMRDSA